MSAEGTEQGSDTGPGSDTEQGSDTDTGTEPLCDCVELDLICADDSASSALHDCALPDPCGVVDGSAEAAECVLGLLVDQQPARFAYRIEAESTDFDSEHWSGWFYILGPNQGIDNECYHRWFDFWFEKTPSAEYYTLEQPAYFQDCIGKSASVMTGCIFNGLSATEAIEECSG